MNFGIKNRIEKELKSYTKSLNKEYSLRKISCLLFNQIKEFVSREGKRLRPMFFVVGYLGYSKNSPPGLYRSALSIELLHDFMLIHDDIIDKSDMRRGKPSVHKQLNGYLFKYKDIKFNGQDLSIVVGDCIYALGLDSFLSIKENPKRKEEALKQLIRAALFTGAGEFLELLSGIKDIKKIKKSDIYKIYDYKTAYYTFSSPLAIGAILAGAEKKEINKLIRYGIYMGRAFQIKDDILGMFGDEKKIGKSIISDLQEAKKTLLIWQAYHNCPKNQKNEIKKIFARKKTGRKDLFKIRKIILENGALSYAKKEIIRLAAESQTIASSLKMKKRFKSILISYCKKITDF